MGGGSSSYASTSVTTKAVATVMAKSIQNCQGNTMQQQVVKIIGDGNIVKGVRMVQSLKISGDCVLGDQNVSETQQKVADEIKQKSDAQSVSVLGALGSSSSQTSAQILSEVKSVITRETIQNIVNNFNQQQEIYINGNSNIVEDITMEQTIDALISGCMQAVSQIKSVQDLSTKTDQTSSATQTNFISDIVDSVGSIFSTMATSTTIVFGLIILVVGALIYSGKLSPLSLMGAGALLGSNSSPDSQQQQEYEEQQRQYDADMKAYNEQQSQYRQAHAVALGATPAPDVTLNMSPAEASSIQAQTSQMATLVYDSDGDDADNVSDGRRVISRMIPTYADGEQDLNGLDAGM
jgi:hypothetical protein